MKKIKLMIIVGTRPEIIKLSEIIKVCDQHFETIFFILDKIITTN